MIDVCGLCAYVCSLRLEEGDETVDFTDVKAILAVIGDQKKQIKELEDKAQLTVDYSKVSLVERMTVNPREVYLRTLVAGCAFFVWQPAGWLETAEQKAPAKAQVVLDASKR